MAKLVSPEYAAEVLNTTPNALMTMACLRKREDGVYPKWYISDGKRGTNIAFVDIEIIERNNQIRKKAWLFATDKLYWLLEAIEGYSMQYFAELLASKTEYSANSWAMWLSRDAWSLPNGNVYELKQNRLFDFIRITTRWIYENRNDIKYVEY